MLGTRRERRLNRNKWKEGHRARHFKRRGWRREGQMVEKRGKERSRGDGSSSSPSLGDQEGWAGEGPPGRKREKGRGKPQGPPRTPHPSPTPGFPIWAGAAGQERPHVCANRGGEVTGAGCRGCKSRKGPRAPPGVEGRLTRGLRGRRPPGPACAAAAERPRPGGTVSREGSERRPGRGVRATNSVTSACFRTTLSGLRRFPRSR